MVVYVTKDFSTMLFREYSVKVSGNIQTEDLEFSVIDIGD